jgi:DNA-binding transcriptional regulator YdaS (Cro superfamily)
MQWPKVRRRTLFNDRQYNDQRSEDVHRTTTDNTMSKGQKTYTEQRQTIQWKKVRRSVRLLTFAHCIVCRCSVYVFWPLVIALSVVVQCTSSDLWSLHCLSLFSVRLLTFAHCNDRQYNEQRSEDVHWTTTDNAMTKGQKTYTEQRQTIQWLKVRICTLNNDRQCNDVNPSGEHELIPGF